MGVYGSEKGLRGARQGFQLNKTNPGTDGRAANRASHILVSPLALTIQ